MSAHYWLVVPVSRQVHTAGSAPPVIFVAPTPPQLPPTAPASLSPSGPASDASPAAVVPGQTGASAIAAAPTSPPRRSSVLEAGELLSGMLIKKGPGAFKASKVRYFRLEAGVMEYYADAGGKKLGEVELTPTSTVTAGLGAWFSVLAASGRVFELEAESEVVRNQWVRGVRITIDALKERAAAMGRSHRPDDAMALPALVGVTSCRCLYAIVVSQLSLRRSRAAQAPPEAPRHPKSVAASSCRPLSRWRVP